MNRDISILPIIYLSLPLPIVIQVFYWLLYLSPGRNYVFYVSISLLVMLIAMISLFLYRDTKTSESSQKKSSQLNLWPKIVVAGIIVIWFVSFIPGYLSQPLKGHDILVYGTEGKIYYRDKSVDAKYDRFDDKSGFESFSRHSPHFPLILTFEKMTRDILGVSQGDDFFKLVTPLSWMAIILIVTFLFYPKGIKYVLIAILAFSSSLLFLEKPLQYHIDMYRMYYMTASMIMFYYAVKKEKNFYIILLGLLCGASAAIHSIGTIGSIAILGAYFIFSGNHFKKRVINIFILGTIIFLMGGGHYIINYFHGNKWLFQ